MVGRFLHMPAEGEWTLGVLDVAVDSSNGTVTSWSLDVEMRPCDWRSALRLVLVNLSISLLELPKPGPRTSLSRTKHPKSAGKQILRVYII